MINNFELSNRNRKVALAKWRNNERVYLNHLRKISRYKKYYLAKARILGFLAGDGSVLIRKENREKNIVLHYEIYFYPDNESLLAPFLNAFTYIYIKKPRVKNLGSYYDVRISSKFACLDLLRVVNLGTYSWRVPFSFLNSKETKIEWLRAFFDCESSILKNQIQLQSVNKIGLLQVHKLLLEFGIESRIYEYTRKNINWGKNYILCIMKKDSRRKFLNIVGFNHSLKFKKLKNQF